MLLNFFRYRSVLLLFLFVSMIRLNGFSSQFEKPLGSNCIQASAERITTDCSNSEMPAVTTSFSNYDFHHNLIATEESCLYQFRIPVESKKKIQRGNETQLIESTFFRDYNYITLASSSYFAPVADLLLELCVFRL